MLADLLVQPHFQIFVAVNHELVFLGLLNTAFRSFFNGRPALLLLGYFLLRVEHGGQVHGVGVVAVYNHRLARLAAVLFGEWQPPRVDPRQLLIDNDSRARLRTLGQLNLGRMLLGDGRWASLMEQLPQGNPLAAGVQLKGAAVRPAVVFDLLFGLGLFGVRDSLGDLLEGIVVDDGALLGFLGASRVGVGAFVLPVQDIQAAELVALVHEYSENYKPWENLRDINKSGCWDLDIRAGRCSSSTGRAAGSQ